MADVSKTLQKLFPFVFKSFNQAWLRRRELVVHLYANELQSVTAHWKCECSEVWLTPKSTGELFFFLRRWLCEWREVKQCAFSDQKEAFATGIISPPVMEEDKGVSLTRGYSHEKDHWGRSMESLMMHQHDIGSEDAKSLSSFFMEVEKSFFIYNPMFTFLNSFL